MTAPQDFREAIEVAVKEWAFNPRGWTGTDWALHYRELLQKVMVSLDQMGRERLGWFEQVEQQRHRAEAALTRLDRLQKCLDEPWYFPEKRIMELEDRLDHLERERVAIPTLIAKENDVWVRGWLAGLRDAKQAMDELLNLGIADTQGIPAVSSSAAGGGAGQALTPRGQMTMIDKSGIADLPFAVHDAGGFRVAAFATQEEAEHYIAVRCGGAGEETDP